jgi:hypothetical protein
MQLTLLLILGTYLTDRGEFSAKPELPLGRAKPHLGRVLSKT